MSFMLISSIIIFESIDKTACNKAIHEKDRGIAQPLGTFAVL